MKMCVTYVHNICMSILKNDFIVQDEYVIFFKLFRQFCNFFWFWFLKYQRKY